MVCLIDISAIPHVHFIKVKWYIFHRRPFVSLDKDMSSILLKVYFIFNIVMSIYFLNGIADVVFLKLN